MTRPAAAAGRPMLAAAPPVAVRRSAPPATVPVPAALQHYQVESTPAATYNLLLGSD